MNDDDHVAPQIMPLALGVCVRKRMRTRKLAFDVDVWIDKRVDVAKLWCTEALPAPP